MALNASTRIAIRIAAPRIKSIACREYQRTPLLRRYLYAPQDDFGSAWRKSHKRA
jgi:hypothetical protein